MQSLCLLQVLVHSAMLACKVMTSFYVLIVHMVATNNSIDKEEECNSVVNCLGVHPDKALVRITVVTIQIFDAPQCKLVWLQWVLIITLLTVLGVFSILYVHIRV